MFIGVFNVFVYCVYSLYFIVFKKMCKDMLCDYGLCVFIVILRNDEFVFGFVCYIKVLFRKEVDFI